MFCESFLCSYLIEFATEGAVASAAEQNLCHNTSKLSLSAQYVGVLLVVISRLDLNLHPH